MNRLTALFKPTLFVIFITLVVTGCAEQNTSSEEKPVIGVSIMTATNPFFKLLGETIADEAGKFGYEAVVVSGDYDISKQKNQVSDFIVQGVDVIVLTPINSKSIGTSIAEANEAGIPVFTADIAVLAEGVQVVSHIATDNYQAGRVAGQAMIEGVDTGGAIGILDFAEVESVILRTRGFIDALNEHEAATGIKFEVVSRLPGGAEKAISYRAAQDMLQAHPDLKGIFAINDPSALGAVAALEESGREDEVVVISVDGQPEGRQAVLEGKIYGDAVQYPDKIARTTVQTIMKYVNGEEVPPEILIPTELYRMEQALQDSSLAPLR
ncbi:MAG: substrate-binding domain-containing protein [Bacteroidota bacterium]